MGGRCDLCDNYCHTYGLFVSGHWIKDYYNYCRNNSFLFCNEICAGSNYEELKVGDIIKLNITKYDNGEYADFIVEDVFSLQT